MLAWLWFVLAIAVASLIGYGIRRLVIRRRNRRWDAHYRELLKPVTLISKRGLWGRDVQ